MSNSIHLYWTSIFILPKAVLKKVNSILAAFLWAGEDKVHYSANVSWKEITTTQGEGGLGVLEITLWNKCLILKLLWNICSKKDTVWVKWIHEEILKNQSIWDIMIGQDSSWAWRHILKLRNLAYPIISVEMGNGKKENFWFDARHPTGPLCLNYTENLLRSFCCPKTDKVEVCIEDGSWN